MSMSASIKDRSCFTSTQRVCEHIADKPQSSRQLANIFVAKQHDFLTPLELFKKGATVMKIGWSWLWINDGSYNIPVRRVSKNKFELALNDLEVKRG